jgi:hypothetical protein
MEKRAFVIAKEEMQTLLIEMKAIRRCSLTY